MESDAVGRGYGRILDEVFRASISIGLTAPPVTCPFLGLVHRMVHPRFAGVDQQVTGGAVHSREAGMNEPRDNPLAGLSERNLT